MIWVECVLGALLAANLFMYWRYLKFHRMLSNEVDTLKKIYMSQHTNIEMLGDFYNDLKDLLLKTIKEKNDVSKRNNSQAS